MHTTPQKNTLADVSAARSTVCLQLVGSSLQVATQTLHMSFDPHGLFSVTLRLNKVNPEMLETGPVMVLNTI